MPPLQLLVKPASGLCDLRCRYCFYADVAGNREVASYGVMDEATLEDLVREALSWAEGSCGFAFQGGEPTLAGLDYYRRLLELQRRHNVHGVEIANSIQTNGLSLDAEWAEFLAEGGFLVGISVDGPGEVHDRWRIDPSGRGTHGRVMDAVFQLRLHGVEHNVLCVVDRDTARGAEETYRWFHDNNYQFIQYIPCLDPFGAAPGSMDWSLTPDDYGDFLVRTFDLWHRDLLRGRGISIRYFENLVTMMMGEHGGSCGMRGHCAIQFVVEADGSVYPCDFYVVDGWRLGSVRESGIAELAASPTARRFLESSLAVDPSCAGCRWLALCRGGCRRDRQASPEGPLGPNRLCGAYRRFFDHAAGRLAELARVYGGRG